MGGGGVVRKTFGGIIVGDTAWSKGLSDRFIPASDFLDDRLLIDGQGKGTADADILKGGTGDVEAIEVGGKKWAGVKVGASAKLGQHEGGNETFIEKEVGLTGGVEIEGGARAGDREGVDSLELGAFG